MLFAGEIFVQGEVNRRNAMHHLVISASDRAGKKARSPAHVWVSVIDSKQQPPVFERSRYSFTVAEDVPVRTSVGTVIANSTDRGTLRFQKPLFFFLMRNRLS